MYTTEQFLKFWVFTQPNFCIYVMFYCVYDIYIKTYYSINILSRTDQNLTL